MEGRPDLGLGRGQGLVALHGAILQGFDKIEVAHEVGESPDLSVVQYELELLLAGVAGVRVEVGVNYLARVLAVLFREQV